MAPKRKGLGRGLDVLIGSSSEPAPSPDRSAAIRDIRPSSLQPRSHFDESTLAELASSIKRTGVLQPLLVRRSQTGFELVAGERRLRAAELAGLDSVPVVIRELSDAETLEIALVENLQREDLPPLDEAIAYRRLADEFGLSQEQIADRLGKSRPAISNALRLLQLPDAIRSELRHGRLTAGHARTLVGVRPEATALDLARRAVAKGWSVRELEAKVAALGRSPRRPRRSEAPEVTGLERELARALGTKVRIEPKGQGGKIVIEFYSSAELEGLRRRLL